MQVTNKEFIEAIFKEDAPYCHVTSFTHDPNNIPTGQHMVAWGGDWWSRTNLIPNSNQYFTISIFNPDENGRARRRKALYLRTRVVVLDDVREKLSLEAANKLPKPSYILETSPGSEQWGYILTTPCDDRAIIDNLNDGLIASELAPKGTDPGQKGVTRYVRLPEGVNTKQSKMIDGMPNKCRLLEWNPSRTVTPEEIAAPFVIDVHKKRRDANIDGAANVPDHPLLQIPDIINVKSTRSDGRFDVTCPWVDEHTDQADDGAAIFTNHDGTIGFKCHHGSCEGRTARDLIRVVDDMQPGYGLVISQWRMNRSSTASFADVVTPVSFINPPTTPTPPVSFIEPLLTQIESVSQIDQQSVVATVPAPPVEPVTLKDVLHTLTHCPHDDPQLPNIAKSTLYAVEQLNVIDKVTAHKTICARLNWTKPEFKVILQELRLEWYNTNKANNSFFDDHIYVKEQNRFFDMSTDIALTPEQFQNSYCDQDPEARKTALQDGAVQKVDKIDFAPRMPRVFEDNGIIYGNTWTNKNHRPGVKGDVEPWLNHFKLLGWDDHINHMTKWMAFTMRYPEKKINHMMILGGTEGTGKDWLLTPLITYMGTFAEVVDGHELLSSFNDYVMNTKYLHVNEAELSDHKQAVEVSNKLKPLATAPPNAIRANIKMMTPIKVRNILNMTMTTNSLSPIKLNGVSRRIFAVWTSIIMRDANHNVLPKWDEYWDRLWKWYENGGIENVIYYLLNDVDLSDFNPGKAPVMTDFLRDIAELSKSPMTATLESIIDEKLGFFACDIVTAEDAVQTIRNAATFKSELFQTDVKWFSAIKIGKILREIPYCMSRRGENSVTSKRLWVIRNHDQYEDMSSSELVTEYEKQLNNRDVKVKLQTIN